MKHKGWLYIYFSVFLLDLLAVASDWSGIRLFSKPLLVATLATWFFINSRTYSSLRFYILIALFFSWLGDLLLLLEQKDALYFIPGLASFLLAHIMYILFFLRVRRAAPAKKSWNIFITAAVSIYSSLLFLFLRPHLGDLKIPVGCYAIVISLMLLCTIHAFNKTDGIAGYWCIAGAVFFVISDSLLAAHKFYHPYAATAILIMFTYGLAQFAIAKGSLQYLASN
jgi:uncharacterized membrane protein YhhN